MIVKKVTIDSCELARSIGIELASAGVGHGHCLIILPRLAALQTVIVTEIPIIQLLFYERMSLKEWSTSLMAGQLSW